MRTIGIVSEYNPFHNGHQYHIEKAKEISHAEAAVCIMSGSFVQRGEPAIFDKWTRTEMALKGGADLIIELPVVYSSQPAEIFAFGAIKAFHSMNIIDAICFGSESGNISQLKMLSKLLSNEPIALKNKIKENLTIGYSYPMALSKALSEFLEGTGEAAWNEIIEKPNNVLAIEYLKSLTKLKSNMEPITIIRTSDYNDIKISGKITSATAIRNELTQKGFSTLVKNAVPAASRNIINSCIESHSAPITLNNFSDIILYKLRIMKAEEMKYFSNVNEGIENRIKKLASNCSSVDELLEKLKVKRYTRTYLQRLLIHMLLGIKKSDTIKFKKISTPLYYRVLGFNEKGRKLIKEIKIKSQYPIISKVADFKTNNTELLRLFELDTLSTDIYSLGSPGINKIGGKDFYTSPIYHI